MNKWWLKNYQPYQPKREQRRPSSNASVGGTRGPSEQWWKEGNFEAYKPLRKSARTEPVRSSMSMADNLPREGKPPTGILENLGYLGAGLGQGIQELGQGIGQVGLEATKYVSSKIGSRETTEDIGDRLREFNEGVEQDRAAFEQSAAGQSLAGDAGQFLGNVVPTMAIGAPAAVVRGGMAARAGYNALVGGGLGAAEYVPEGESRLQNALTATATGGVGSIGLEGATRAGAKAFNVARGRVEPEADEIMRASQQYDVPLSAGDIRPTTANNMIENRLGRIPVVGMSGFRQRQGEAASNAIQRYRDRMAEGLDDDTGALTKRSLEKGLKREREVEDQLFENMAQKAGNSKIPTNNLNRVAREVIDREAAEVQGYGNKELMDSIEKYTRDPQRDFMGLRRLNTELREKVDGFYQGRNSIGKNGVQDIQALKKALDADMEQYASQNGGQLLRAWKKYNKHYRENVIRYEKEADVRNALANLNPDEIHRTFIKPGTKDRAARFYDLMDDEGRSAVRLRIIEDALEKARRDEDFSPAKFAGELERMDAPSQVFFRGKEYDELKGFQKLMRAAAKGGQTMMDPPTGQAMEPYVVGGIAAALGLTGGPTAILAGAGAAKGLSMLFTTRAGKRLLLAAGRARGSKLDEIQMRLARALSTQTQDAGGDRETGQGTNAGMR